MYASADRLTEVWAALLAALLAVGLLLASTGGLSAEWRPYNGWGPYPVNPYPHPYPDGGISAGVAAGVVGIAAGSVLNNVLNDPEPQPVSPPSSVYVAPPTTTYNAPPVYPGAAAQPYSSSVIHAGSFGPATGAVRWDPDCNQPVAPSGVYVNGRLLGPTACQ